MGMQITPVLSRSLNTKSLMNSNVSIPNFFCLDYTYTPYKHSFLPLYKPLKTHAKVSKHSNAHTPPSTLTLPKTRPRQMHTLIPKTRPRHTHTSPTPQKTQIVQRSIKREERMTTGVAEMMLRCVFEGTLTVYDTEIERRPYHRNCSCALHTLKGACSNPCFHQRKISYPKKHSWTECSLSTSTSKLSSQSFVNDSSVRNREDSGEAVSSRR